MSEQLAAAAAAMGVPEALVERSARARAEATGESVEAVIAAWAGGEALTAAPPPAAEVAAPEEPGPAVAEDTEALPPETPAPETPVPVTTPTPAAPAPAPERVSPEEAHEHPVVVTVPTAGITERMGFSIPTWLSALLLVVPAFGLVYMSMAAAADCGAVTELRVDRVTGLVENCDGSPFEGRGTGVGADDPLALGAQVFPTCAGCHGAEGQGLGTFPALTGVMNTFGACEDHIEWVELGSPGFAAQGTYGDDNRPVGGGMPAFGGSLSAEQLAAVVAYERVRHGGGNPEEVLVDCGLAAPDEDVDGELGGEVEGEGEGDEEGEGEEAAGADPAPED